MDMVFEDARAIYDAALAAADAFGAVSRHLRLDGDMLVIGSERLPLGAAGRVVVIGAGKASARMAQAAEDALGERIAGGIVSVKDGHTVPTRRVRVIEAGHPLPDERSLANGQAILNAVHHLREDDVVLCLWSGGGSALMEAPVEGLSLYQLRNVTRALMLGGANIVELNCVRKHLSQIKGGQLARHAAPARVIALVLSDVIGDDLSSIASGPAYPDPTTFADAVELLRRYGAVGAADTDAAAAVLARGAAGNLAETPKADGPLFARVKHFIIGSNRMALDAAAVKARSLGYAPHRLTSYLQGEAREVGRVLGAIAREQAESAPAGARVCWLAGGETTVTVRGKGRGGRNQECALAAAQVIDGVEHVALLCAATDGGDGSSDAAGALLDGKTLDRARAIGLSAQALLEDNNSHVFFESLNAQVKPGPTLTNVNDIVVMLVGQAANRV